MCPIHLEKLKIDTLFDTLTPVPATLTPANLMSIRVRVYPYTFLHLGITFPD